MREYIEQGDTLVIKTTYDAEPALLAAEAARQAGKVQIGSKGQELTLACVLPLEHIEKIKNEGHGDLLSPDPAEYRRALVYIQQHEQQFMATDKKAFAIHRPKWQ